MTLRSTAISSAAQLYRPSSVASSGAALTAGSIDDRAYYSDPGGMPGVRKAIKLRNSAGQTRYSVYWGPSTPACAFEFYAAPTLYPLVSAAAPMGLNSSTRAYVSFNTNGEILVKFLGNVMITASGAQETEIGVWHKYRVEFGVNTQELYKDDVLIGSGTSTFSYDTNPQTHYIGSHNSGFNVPELLIRDVKFIDLVDDTYTAVYPLDGNLLNTHPGSIRGDASTVGTFWTQYVNLNTPGASNGVPAFSPAITENSKATATSYTGATYYYLSLGTATQDDFGRIDGSGIDYSEGSWVEADVSLVLKLVTKGGTGTCNTRINDLADAHDGPVLNHAMNAGDVVSVSMRHSFMATTTNELRPSIGASDAADTWEVSSITMVVQEQRV